MTAVVLGKGMRWGLGAKAHGLTTPRHVSADGKILEREGREKEK